MPIRQYTYRNEVGAPKKQGDIADGTVIGSCRENACHWHKKATEEEYAVYHHKVSKPLVVFFWGFIDRPIKNVESDIIP